MIYFVDFEASSLWKDSFPIEVAWVDENGQPEHYLIRPHPAWLENGCPGWDPAAEELHGISLATLLAEGTPVEEVAARAAEVLLAPGAVGLSDSAMDELWLGKLFDHGGVRASVHLYDVQQAYGAACRPLLRLLPPPEAIGRERAEERVSNLAEELVARAEEQEALRPRTRHRAFSDADSLWRTWRSVGELVTEWLEKELPRG